MAYIRVTSDDMVRLAAAIRSHADPKAMRRELNRGLSSASKPVREEMRATAISSLPVRGGLQARMNSIASKGRTTAAGGRGAGVRINFAKNSYDARTLRGRIRHPLFGNRRFWFSNSGSPVDAIDAEFQRQKPVAAKAVAGVMDEIARKVTNI